LTRFVAFIAGHRASPAQPAQQFPRAAPTEFSAQRGRLTSGDSFGAHGVGERGLKLADSMFGLIDQLCSRSSCDRSVSTAPFSASIIRETVRNCPGSAIRGAVSGTSAGSPWPDIRAGSPPRPGSARSGLARLPHLCQGDNHPDNTVVADLSRPTSAAGQGMEGTGRVTANPPAT